MCRIVFPIGAFYPDMAGGASFSTYWLTKALTKTGQKVSVVTTTRGLNGRYPENRWVDIEGIRVYYSSGNLMYNLRMFIVAISTIRSADIVHLSSIFYRISLPLCLVSLLMGKKVVWSIHGELSESAIQGSLLKNLYVSIIRLLTSRIIFHTTAPKETLEVRKCFKKAKVVEVPNYMELPAPLSLPKEHKLIFVGRINPIKALDKLIEALSLSQKFRESDFKFYIVGDDKAESAKGYIQKLKKQITSLGLDGKIYFPGPAYGEEKEWWYASSYCTFLVSYTENFGNVVVESLAQGTPAVASLGTPWRMLEEHKIGRYIANDPKILGQTIDEILSLPGPEYKQMCDRCIRVARKQYSIYEHIEEWLDVYKKI